MSPHKTKPDSHGFTCSDHVDLPEDESYELIDDCGKPGVLPLDGETAAGPIDGVVLQWPTAD